MKRQEFKGEIAAFLSIVFVLLLSLVGALIQSASIYIAKSRSRADTQLAMESYFAEYQDKVWEKYGILVREGTEERQIAKRLEFYGAFGTHEVQKLRLLSDGQGQAFYEQAVRLMGGTAGGDGGQADSSFTQLPETDIEAEEETSQKELAGLLEQEEQELPSEDNPISGVENLKKSSLLSLIHPNPESLSPNGADLTGLASHRTLQEGNMGKTGSTESEVVNRALFLAYLSTHFSCYEAEEEQAEAAADEDEGLRYELEYLLAGEAGDQANLEQVAKKILELRMALNYAHILTDTEKKAEADAMALSLTALFTVPMAKEIVKHALLLAWAYGESVVDLRVLFQGKKVPLVKTRENWQLQLANLAKLGTAEESVSESDGSQGIRYEEYLKGFLLTADRETLCMRALDLIELKLGIQADACVAALEVQTTCTLQRGIRERFVTRYQY